MAWKTHFKQTHFHRVLLSERGLAYPTCPWCVLGTPELDNIPAAGGLRDSCVPRHLLSLDLEFWMPQPRKFVFKFVQECSWKLQEDAEGSVSPRPFCKAAKPH